MVLFDLRWHLRALRSQSRWARTRAVIADWLAQAPEGHEDLILFGASAGWMMDDAFLARFRRIDAVDFEWAAAPLFSWRHASVIRERRIAVTFHRTEAIAQLGDSIDAIMEILLPQGLIHPLQLIGDRIRGVLDNSGPSA